MVEPAQMRDLVQRKSAILFKEIAESLNHNPHLYQLYFLLKIWMSKRLSPTSKKHPQTSCLRRIKFGFEGTHAAIETHLIPEYLNFAFKLWWVDEKDNGRL